MKIAVLISFSGQGGVERMVMNLVRELAKKESFAIDLLTIRASGPHLKDVPQNVNHINLKSKHTFTAIPELVAYLKRENPAAMLAAKDRAGRAATRAKMLSGVKTRVVVRLGTNLSTALEGKSSLQKYFRTAPMKRLYNKMDNVVAVSEGVKKDIVKITGINQDRVKVIRNPVVTDQMLKAASESPPHSWLQDKKEPVIMGIGRLSYQKNFECLIKAFAILVEQEKMKLIILGDGKELDALKKLAESLGLTKDILFAGFQSNPYAWLARADLFVLSSRWEGSPNVLTEALALGIPSVSTRCPSGPDEVLDDGKYGILVELEDHVALAEAMSTTLNKPLHAAFLKEAVKAYTPDVSASAYMNLLLENK